MTLPRRTLLHVFPSFEIGGAQLRFVQLANHFGRCYRHVIVAMDGLTAAKERLSPDVEAILLPFPAGQTVLKIRSMLREVRPDLLITSNWGTIDWAIANLSQRVAHVHLEDGFGREEAQQQFKRRIWTRRLVLRNSTVVVPSRGLFRIASEIWKLPSGALMHIENGVNCTRFSNNADAALAAKYGVRPEIPVIGTIGALRAEKNQRRLLEAFALVVRSRPAQLLIVGDGPERASLQHAAETLGIAGQVVFTGTSPVPEQLLPMFSLFALSSDTEQMPLSILEAMAASRAIAATDVGEIGEMVAPENQRFVVRRHASALANAMLELLAEPARAKEVGRANRARAVAVYDESKMFGAYRRLFDGERKIQ